MGDDSFMTVCAPARPTGGIIYVAPGHARSSKRSQRAHAEAQYETKSEGRAAGALTEQGPAAWLVSMVRIEQPYTCPCLLTACKHEEPDGRKKKSFLQKIRQKLQAAVMLASMPCNNLKNANIWVGTWRPPPSMRAINSRCLPVWSTPQHRPPHRRQDGEAQAARLPRAPAATPGATPAGVPSGRGSVGLEERLANMPTLVGLSGVSARPALPQRQWCHAGPAAR